jgi:hypothetical protein
MHPIREWQHYQERKIIDSVFPEKLTFDGIQFRTTRINESSEYMLLVNSEIGDNKCETNSSVLDLSLRVDPTVQNSNHLIAELESLSEILTE